jgi:hypothetical protein
MQSFLKYYIMIGLFSIVTSCKKNDGKDATNPPAINAQEQITTVVLTGYNELLPDDPSYKFAVTWQDLDGTGGNAPVIDSLLLDTGIQYHVSVLLLDKTQTPWDTVSNEVEEKKNYHQFFYAPDSHLKGKMNITILDFDNNTPSLPVGLKFRMDTRSSLGFTLPVAGNLNMVLSHYDGIPKTASRSPESDIDILFPVRLQ